MVQRKIAEMEVLRDELGAPAAANWKSGGPRCVPSTKAPNYTPPPSTAKTLRVRASASRVRATSWCIWAISGLSPV